MKFLFLYLGIIFLNGSGNSFYNIDFEALDGTLIKTSSFEGKKVVIAIISANNAGITLVRYLDSVQKASANVQVIAIPTADFDGSTSLADLKNLAKNVSIIVAKTLKVKNSNSTLQHPLFVWLTQVKENQHLDMDVDGEEQVFVVSAKGILYSVLPKDTPIDVVGKIINENFTE